MKASPPRESKTPTLADFLARGYLPKELPCLFNTGQIARIADNAVSALPTGFWKKCTKSLAIPVGAKGGKRRTAAIPNAISQTRLVKVMVDGWPQISAHCDHSEISFSRLFVSGEERTLRNERRGDPLHSYESIILTKEFSQKRPNPPGE